MRAASAGRRLAAQFDTCPICHDAFLDADVVINLPCSHNMHAVCVSSSATASGLCAWLAAGHVTCPCCRAPFADAQA
jgi:hypothetical protein